jgi:hypothetical protein
VAGEQGLSWERVLTVGGSIVAPATALSTLLFYFGYVSTREQYLFFGLDVDTIGLNTQGFIMRSPQPLLVPLLTLTLVAAAAVLAARRLRARIVPLAGHGTRLGLVVLGLGLVLLFAYPALGDAASYALVTPLVLALGGTIAAYSLGLRQAPMPARVALWLAVATAVFWANATVAQWSGAGLAQEQADHLDELPQVVLDTRERLYLRSPGVEETALQTTEGQTFRYRYRGLRLLIQNGDRMFLVPCTSTATGCAWQTGNATLLVRLGDTVRVQFLAP